MNVVVVGGGISGLSAAHALAEAGVACTLIERDSRLGGVIRTDHVEGCLVEAGPDSFLTQKTAAADLIRQVGLGDELIGSNDRVRRTYVVRDSRLLPLPEGVQFMAPTRLAPLLSTPLLSPGAKLRMALEWFRRPSTRPGDCSVADFVRDHYGAEAVEYLAQPMLAGVYGGEPEDLSVASVLPRFVEIEKRYGSLSRGLVASRRSAKQPGAPAPLFQTLKGGLQALVDRLVERLRDRVEIVHAKAEAVRPRPGGWEVSADGAVLQAEHVVLALPAHRSAQLLEDAEPQLAARLRGIPYQSSITAGLVYRRPAFDRELDGFGFLVPRAENRLIAACTWVNTKFDHRAPPERPLLRAFLAGRKAEANLGEPDESIASRIGEDLQTLMEFRAAPIAQRVNRWPRAMAQYEVGHSDRVRAIEEQARSLAGLHVGGNGFDGIGIPDCIRRSQAIVERILDGG